jgi:hypothetical protein
VKRFESVQVLKRFASISDPSQVILVIIVDEGPVRIETTGDPDQPTRVVRSNRAHLLFLPVLNFEDGYGFTYGARFAWPEPWQAEPRRLSPDLGRRQAGGGGTRQDAGARPADSHHGRRRTVAADQSVL